MKREEAQTLILDQCSEGVRKDVGQRGILIRIWRECEAFETLRVERKAKGVGADDLEDPLPEGEQQHDVQSFDSHVHWEPHLSELLCEPLYGRIKREAKRQGIHTVIPLDRVRSAAEVSRTAVGKTLGMAPGIDIKVMSNPMPTGPREGGVRDHYLLVWLVQLLFLGRWAVLGQAYTVGGAPWVSFRRCMEYPWFIRERVTPLKGPFPDLARCIRCEHETRSLWANSMSKGKTLEQAMAENEPKQAALWLWTTESENHNAPAAPELPQDRPATCPPPPPPASHRSRSPRGAGRPPLQRTRPQGSTTPAASVTLSATHTRGGKRICEAWNAHPNGFSDTNFCKWGFAHLQFFRQPRRIVWADWQAPMHTPWLRSSSLFAARCRSSG